MSPEERADLNAEALFSTHFQPSDHISAESVRAAVAFRVSMMTSREIAATVAQEFGDHPDQAVERMNWCRAAVAEAFADVPVWPATRVTSPAPGLPPGLVAPGGRPDRLTATYEENHEHH